MTADTVELRDGSRLVGEVVEMDSKLLIINTAFSGNLEIKSTQISGITTDNKVRVSLSSGDTVAGRLEYVAGEQQKISNTLFGDITLDNDIKVVGINDAQGRSEEIKLVEKAHAGEVEELQAEHKQEKQALKENYEEEISALQQDRDKLEDPWSGNIAFGLTGQHGNTEETGIQGRGELRRETDFDRLFLYTEGNLQRQNGETTTNEVLAGALLERDFTRRWYVFGSVDFEKDEFEDLSLRGIAQTGLGYFLVREPHAHLKGFAGIGYQHEAFTDGTTAEEGVLSAGYDFLYDYNDWLRFGHKLTYFPVITSPASDYRLVSDALTEMPLVKGEAWKLRFNLRNQYDNNPQPGVKKLDTSYLLNLVYDWE